jgi:DNA-binding transcriptional ArsR family regulator
MSKTGEVAADKEPLALSVPLSVVKADLFKALANPSRIRVLELLSDGERSVGEMQPLVGTELSHLSHQLGLLRRAGLVVTRKEGSTVYYRVKDPVLVDLLRVAKQLLLHTLTENNLILAELAGS